MHSRKRVIKRLERLFDQSEHAVSQGLPIRVTREGIWVPTPPPVLHAAIEIARAAGVFQSSRSIVNIVDAGAGDGRLAIELALLQPGLSIHGIECDRSLLHQAVLNLEELRRERFLTGLERIRFGSGDYCDLETYASLGLRWEDIHLVMNYPDGNQHRLEEFMLRFATPGAYLCLLTHDGSLALSTIELLTKEEVRPSKGAPPWHLSIYKV